jgi:putative transposase
MPRFARVVAVGCPHHVVHRGNRRQPVFRTRGHAQHYLHLLRKYSVQRDLEVWAYCLMPNHVHLLVLPRRPESLAEAIGLAHRCFAQAINRELHRTGHLWENRFYSSALDETHLWAAVRYIERNPLRARIVDRAEEYGWSSARSHVLRVEDPILSEDRPFAGAAIDWSRWLSSEEDAGELELLRTNTCSGRPTGSDDFVNALSAKLKRDLRVTPRGRPTTGTPSAASSSHQPSPSTIDFLAF